MADRSPKSSRAEAQLGGYACTGIGGSTTAHSVTDNCRGGAVIESACALDPAHSEQIGNGREILEQFLSAVYP
jgi:hypothetical protein